MIVKETQLESENKSEKSDNNSKQVEYSLTKIEQQWNLCHSTIEAVQRPSQSYSFTIHYVLVDLPEGPCASPGGEVSWLESLCPEEPCCVRDQTLGDRVKGDWTKGGNMEVKTDSVTVHMFWPWPWEIRDLNSHQVDSNININININFKKSFDLLQLSLS